VVESKNWPRIVTLRRLVNVTGPQPTSRARQTFLVVPHQSALQRGFTLPVAFVLINAEIGSEDEVVTELRKIGNVKESYVVYGVYDIVAKVEAESMDKLKEIVTWKIRRLDKVRSTLTMIVVEGT
jgi:DNA-binding Lrp family transcriptional regulator